MLWTRNGSVSRFHIINAVWSFGLNGTFPSISGVSSCLDAAEVREGEGKVYGKSFVFRVLVYDNISVCGVCVFLPLSVVTCVELTALIMGGLMVDLFK